MPTIDEKMAALDFSVTTSRSPGQVMQLITDAAAVAGAGGPKTTLTQLGENHVTGVTRNFARVALGEFSVELLPEGESHTQVRFTIRDFLRTRDTLLGFIPVSPWGAPGYGTLAALSQYMRSRL